MVTRLLTTRYLRWKESNSIWTQITLWSHKLQQESAPEEIKMHHLKRSAASMIAVSTSFRIWNWSWKQASLSFTRCMPCSTTMCRHSKVRWAMSLLLQLMKIGCRCPRHYKAIEQKSKTLNRLSNPLKFQVMHKPTRSHKKPHQRSWSLHNHI